MSCAGVGVNGLVVAVVDSVSGVTLAQGATLLTYDASSGARIDSVVGSSNDAPLYGADDRRGTYNVVVRKAGYLSWSRQGVIVHDGCPHIEIVNLTARLVLQ